MASVVVTWAGIYVPESRSVTYDVTTAERVELFTRSVSGAVYSLDNYPTFPQWQGTRLVLRTGIRERLAPNNEYRTRDLPYVTKHDAIVIHDMLSRTDRNRLVAFYDAQCRRSFHFLAAEDNVTRDVVFAADGLQIEPVRDYPDRYRATVKLLET